MLLKECYRTHENGCFFCEQCLALATLLTLERAERLSFLEISVVLPGLQLGMKRLVGYWLQGCQVGSFIHIFLSTKWRYKSC